ncbi:MAG TPA: hypothetical protein PK503_03695 [Azonexus sp.]|jgi:hypothetical protein|nr:hypothetical protein [Azonexus sp.]
MEVKKIAHDRGVDQQHGVERFRVSRRHPGMATTPFIGVPDCGQPEYVQRVWCSFPIAESRAVRMPMRLPPACIGTAEFKYQGCRA